MIDLGALDGPGGSVAVGEAPAERRGGGARGDLTEGLAARGEPAALGGPGRGGRDQGQAQLDGVGERPGSARRQGCQLGGGAGHRGGEEPPGGNDVAGEQAGEGARGGHAAGFEVPAVALPGEDQALEGPAGGRGGPAGWRGGQGGDQPPGLGRARRSRGRPTAARDRGARAGAPPALPTAGSPQLASRRRRARGWSGARCTRRGARPPRGRRGRPPGRGSGR